MTLSVGIPRWRKALHASPRELVARGTQAVAAFSERLPLSSLNREPSLAALQRLLPETMSRVTEANLLEHFRHRSAPRFFAGLDEPESTIDTLRALWPGRESAIIAAADKAIAGRFDVLGRSGLDFGRPIDWSLDPVNGIRAPGDHWSRIPFLSASIVGDHKIIWELNRHQHFVRFGQAYVLTRDERYASAFAMQIEGWLDANPPQRGMNWVSSLELSFRAIAWLWALQFFRTSPALTPQLFRRILGSLYLHGRHIERHLSTYFSPNTHLSGEALGLLYLGALLPELRCAERWRRLGARLLIDLLDRHVLSDGVYFERATYYQRYTADFYLHALLLSDRNDLGLRVKIVPALARLVEHLAAIERPDGLTPLIGDDDGGSLLPLGSVERSTADFRSTLCVAGAVLGRDEWIRSRREAADDALWLVGASTVSQSLTDASPATPPSLGNRSRGFAEGGYYVLRDRPGADANYALFDCGPLGTGNCGHAHADVLALELCANGVAMFVDAGTYTYSAPRERDHFRSTRAHSTLLVDGQPSSVPAGPFSWQHAASARTTRWISTDRFDFVRGVHDGFRRLSSPAMHARSILFVKGDYWIVRDDVESADTHSVELRWQLAAGVHALEHRGANLVLERQCAGRTGRLAIASTGPANCAYRVDSATVSPGFGASTSAAALSLTASLGPQESILTLLVPETKNDARRTAASTIHLSVMPTVRGGLWSISRTDQITDLLMSDSCLSRDADVECDADWAWIRGGADSLVREFLLIGGSRLRYRDLLEFDAERRCEYIVGVLDDNGWAITADASWAVRVKSGGERCAMSAVGKANDTFAEAR